MLTKNEKARVIELEKLRAQLVTVRKCIAPFDQVISDIPAISVEFRELWRQRDIAFRDFHQLDKRAEEAIKQIDREIASFFEEGEVA